MTTSEPPVLDLIDAALAEGRVTAPDAEGREVQELALALRAESPEPDPGFAADLDRRAAAGFPRERRLSFGLLDRLRAPLPLAAAAASVLLALIVATTLFGDGGTDDGTPTTVDPTSEPERESSGDRKAAAPAIEAVPPDGAAAGGSVAPGRERRIERSAQLTLAAPDGELERVGDQVIAVTDRRRGFVVRSSVSTGDAGPPGGTFELRVPAAALAATLRDLSALADVRARSQAGEDVTAPYVRVSDRLAQLRAERRGLLRRLAQDPSEGTRRRLDAVDRRIGLLRGRVKRLQERTDYATVLVSLVESDGDSDDGGAGAGPIDEAVDDSLGIMAATLGVALRALAVLLPLAVLGGMAWVGSAALRRRRREAALS